MIIITTHHSQETKETKTKGSFWVARKPQLNPGVGGTGRQPLNKNEMMMSIMMMMRRAMTS